MKYLHGVDGRGAARDRAARRCAAPGDRRLARGESDGAIVARPRRPLTIRFFRARKSKHSGAFNGSEPNAASCVFCTLFVEVTGNASTNAT